MPVFLIPAIPALAKAATFIGAAAISFLASGCSKESETQDSKEDWAKWNRRLPLKDLGISENQFLEKCRRLVVPPESQSISNYCLSLFKGKGIRDKAIRREDIDYHTVVSHQPTPQVFRLDPKVPMDPKLAEYFSDGAKAAKVGNKDKMEESIKNIEAFGKSSGRSELTKMLIKTIESIEKMPRKPR